MQRALIPGAKSPPRAFLLGAVSFVLVGLVLYACLYGRFFRNDLKINIYGRQNRFFMVKTAPRMDYDYVILGASHSAVFDYRGSERVGSRR